MLRSIGKVRIDKDSPDLPESVIDRVSGLKRDGEITTQDFRNEFYRATALPILIGDKVFSDGILEGIKRGVFVYMSGELLCGKGDPPCIVSIDANSIVYTVRKAGRLGIWPHKPVVNKPDEPDERPDDGTTSGPVPKSRMQPIRTFGKPGSAILEVLDKLHRRGIKSITKIRLESKDDVFPMLSIIASIRDADMHLQMEGDYQAGKDGSFRFEFNGMLNDSGPVREFLKSQMLRTDAGNVSIILDIVHRGDRDVDWLETLASRVKWAENDIEVSA